MYIIGFVSTLVQSRDIEAGALVFVFDFDKVAYQL